MRVSEKFKNLKKDDTVIIYYPDNNREKPIEGNIVSIGRKFITVKDIWNRESKFTKEHGYGDFGKYIFPGPMEDFEEYLSLKEYKRDVRRAFENALNDLTKSELDSLMSIIKS